MCKCIIINICIVCKITKNYGGDWILNWINILMLAEAETTTPNTTMSTLSTLLTLGIVVVVFYFFILRPQKKQEKETTQMRNDLQVGDEITTTGGIIGKIVSMKDETVMIETGKDKTKIRILKSAVRNVDVKAEDAE